MLVRWVTSSLRLPLECNKPSTPQIVADHVQLSVFTSSRLAHNSSFRGIVGKTVWCWRESHPLALAPHMSTKMFWDLQFSLVIINHNKNLGLTAFSIICLFFNFNFLWAVQLRYWSMRHPEVSNTLGMIYLSKHYTTRKGPSNIILFN